MPTVVSLYTRSCVYIYIGIASYLLAELYGRRDGEKGGKIERGKEENGVKRKVDDGKMGWYGKREKEEGWRGVEMVYGAWLSVQSLITFVSWLAPRQGYLTL